MARSSGLRLGALREAFLQLGKPHDNRAAYACERYQELTGAAAPVIAGRRDVIAATIWKRFHVGPRHMRVKHLRWYLEVATRDLSTTHRYRLWTTVRVFVIALDHGEDWLGRLRGGWIRPTGNAVPLRAGRPAKLTASITEN